MSQRDMEVCPDCRGTGRYVPPRPTARRRLLPVADGRDLGGFCPACGGAGVLWSLPPDIRFAWKSLEASRTVFERFRLGRLEFLRTDRFDGSVGYLIYVLEEKLRKQVLIAARNPTEGIIALFMTRRRSDLTEVVLVLEPVRRPREYESGGIVTLCRVFQKGSPARVESRTGVAPGLGLYRRWRDGTLEELDLEEPSGFCDLVRSAVRRFERKHGVEVVAAYRNPREHLVALLSVDPSNAWHKVGFVPEFRMREQIPFRIPHVTVGGSLVRRELFPKLG